MEKYSWWKALRRLAIIDQNCDYNSSRIEQVNNTVNVLKDKTKIIGRDPSDWYPYSEPKEYELSEVVGLILKELDLKIVTVSGSAPRVELKKQKNLLEAVVASAEKVIKEEKSKKKGCDK